MLRMNQPYIQSQGKRRGAIVGMRSKGNSKREKRKRNK
jgi:hypothetical protein